MPSEHISHVILRVALMPSEHISLSLLKNEVSIIIIIINESSININAYHHYHRRLSSSLSLSMTCHHHYHHHRPSAPSSSPGPPRPNGVAWEDPGGQGSRRSSEPLHCAPGFQGPPMGALGGPLWGPPGGPPVGAPGVQIRNRAFVREGPSHALSKCIQKPLLGSSAAKGEFAFLKTSRKCLNALSKCIQGKAQATPCPNVFNPSRKCLNAQAKLMAAAPSRKC